MCVPSRPSVDARSPRTVPVALQRPPVALAALLLALPTAAAAQSPDWSANLAIQAYPSPYLSDWERVPSTALLSVTHTGSAPADYVVSVTLRSTERGFVGTIESPGQQAAGGVSTFLFNARDAITEWGTRQKTASITDVVFRTGQIPEGRYRACATVLVGAARVPSAESCADFTILLPDAPQLVTPLRGDVVRTAQPFFSWTPVVAPPELGVGYRLRVVEVIGRQAPLVALSANIPLLDEVVTGAPFRLYPLDGVQLEPGKRYAWRVTATTAEGEVLFRDRVASEIGEFTMDSELLGALPTLAALGDTAVVQPGVAVIRGLQRARARADVAAGAFIVDGDVELVLPSLPGRPAIPVTVSNLQVGMRGGQPMLVGGELRVARPRGLLPDATGALVHLRELRASPRTGVTASMDVGVPGQGMLSLLGTFQLTALGWYGRGEGTSNAADGFAQVARGLVGMTLRRARLDLPAGTLEVGGAVRLLGGEGACEDVWSRAEDGIVRASLSCRPTRALPLAARGPTDFVADAVVGTVTADLLADTVGYALALGGRARLFGDGAPCHVEAVLRLTADSASVLQQASRCDQATAVQSVGDWLRFRYTVARLDTVRLNPDGTLWWMLGFEARPELVASPSLALPAFVNAWATRDSIVLPAPPALLQPDAAAIVDQFRVVTRRGRHARVARAWSQWNAADDAPYAWRVEGDAWFEPTLRDVQPCLASRFRISPDSAGFRLARGRLGWTAARADYGEGCRVDVSPGLAATVYRVYGPVSVALAAQATTDTLPRSYVVLEDPIWPPPTTTFAGTYGPAAAVVDTVLGGAARAVQSVAGAVVGEVVNGILDGTGLCGLLRDVPVDFRGRFRGSATVAKGCEVKVGLGRLTPYTGRFAFGPLLAAGGQQVRWLGGTRLSLDTTLAGRQRLEDSVRTARAADSVARADSARRAADPTWQRIAALNRQKDSLELLRVRAAELSDSLAAADSLGTGALHQQATAASDRADRLRALVDSVKLVADTMEATKLAADLKAKARADSIARVAADSAKGATGGLAGTATSAAGGLAGASLPTAGAGDADDPDTEIDWNTGRILRGSWRLRGPFVVEPLQGMAFRLRDIPFDTSGMRVDGRVPLLYLESADSAMTQWSGVRLDWQSRRLRAGVVSFPTGFALETGTAARISGARVDTATTTWDKVVAVAGLVYDVADLAFSTGNWRVRPSTAASGVVNGMRLAVDGQPVLDARGLAVRGESPITGSLFGAAAPPARLRYSDDFVLRDWKTVAQGRATLEVGTTPVATWDAGGWRLAVAELVTATLPRRLPLPTEAVAYLQVRDSATNALLVEMSDAGTAWRLTTPRGAVPLVVPALASMLGGTAPRAQVTLDITVDKQTFALRGGSVAASVRGVPGFDLASAGLPFALERVAYEKAGAGVDDYRLTMDAALALLGEATPTGRARITVDGNGIFGGEVSLPVARAVPLGAPQVQLQVDALTGRFDGDVARGLDFRIDATGGLRVTLDPQRPWQLATTLRLSRAGAEFVTTQSGTPPVMRLGVPGAALLLGNARLPLLAWDAVERRVRFDVLFDLGVEIAALDSLALPAIRDIHLRETGLEIPRFEIGEVSAQMVADGVFGSRAAGPIEAAGFGVRPLALRMEAMRWGFGAPPPVPDLRLDVELSVRNPGAPPPDDLAAFKVRVLDLGWRDGALRGDVEPVEFSEGIRTPFGAIRGAWGRFAVGARSEVHLYVGADVQLPDVFGCPAQRASFAVATRGGKDTLELLPGGAVRGTVSGFAPSCTGALGPLAFRVVDSRLEFAGGPGVAPRATLDGTVRLSLAGGAGADSVRVDGRLAVNLLTGEIVDASATVAQPFRWRPDPRNPLLDFTVQSARLDRTAFTFEGSGALALVGGGGAQVRFDSLAWGFREARFTRGRATVTTDLALGAEIGDAGLVWGAFPAGTPRGTGAGFRLTLPAGMVIDADGIAISGTAVASLAFGQESFSDLAVAFEDGFRLATTGPVRVTRGAARLRGAQQQVVAWIDSTGFRPGDVFAVLPIPDRLGLPSQDVAYLVLGNGSRRFVELVQGSDGRSHLRTPAGTTIDLVLPSLAYGGPAPVVKTAFDLVVEPRTMQVIGGSLVVSAPAGQSLVPLQGLPVDIQRLGFAAGSNGWQLTASARVKLPGALAATPLVLDSLVVGPSGLSGVAELGTITDRWAPGLPSIAQVPIAGDSLRLALHAVRVAFATGQAPDVALTGTVTTALLAGEGGAPAPLFLRGRVSATGFEAAADLSALGGAGIPLGVAVLRPASTNTQAPIRFVADAQRTALEFGASLELTSLSPGLSVAMDTIHIGSDGVRVSPLTVDGAGGLSFQLFGLTFTLRDSVAGGARVYPALAGRFDGRVLKLEMTGDVELMENTSRFTGLRIGSDGELAIAGASLLSRPIEIIEDRLRLDSLGISQGMLRGTASVVLPAPFDARGGQKVRLAIAPDGRVTGGGTVVIFEEAEGLARAQTKIEVGVATFHMRYLAATLDFERPRERTSVDLVSDIYIANDSANLVRLGRMSGGVIQAGLRVSLSGVSWSGLEVPRPISVVLGPVKLTLTSATATTSPRGLSASVSGKLGLALEMASGGLSFQDIRLTEEGEITLASARIDGGSISITDMFALDVRDLGYGDRDTVIAVPADNVRPTSGAATVPPMQMARVSSFLRFRASATIANVFSGGVRQLLVYKLADDGTTHILVDSLGASVQDVFSLTASMRFDEYTDGFSLQVAGSAELVGGPGVMMAGVIAHRAGTTRAGLFVAASGINIQLIPGVVSLVGVGGGFFINPEPGDLTMVREMAQITGTSSNALGPPPASQFAIMLYAEFVGFGQGSTALVGGRALITVTDRAFRLDAKVAFLNKDKELVGNLALQVGWEPQAYLLGDATLNVNFDSVATGTARLQFAVGGNAFAVKGNVAMKLFTVLDADTEIIIVPSGFATSMSVGIARTFWVVKLEARLSGQLWFRPSTSDLGAYVELRGLAEIPGLIGLEARLAGALIIMPKFGLYLTGMGRAYVLGESVSIAFWASVGADGFGGGLGENPELNAAIARARAVSDELRAEADSIIRAVQNQVTQLAVQPVVASEATLGRVFENAKGWAGGSNWAYFLGVALNVGGESVYPAGVDRSPYFATYMNYLRQRSAPADTQAIAAIRVEAQRKLDILAARRDEMLARIATLQARIDSVRAVTMPDIPNPVRAFSVGDPAIGVGTGAAAGGRTPATLTGLPVLDVDDAAAAQGRAALQRTAGEIAARQVEVIRALEQAQVSLDTVRAALSATQSSSLMGYLRLWADAVEATEQQHASTVDYVMRRWRWTREGRAFVADNRAAFRALVQSVSSGIAGDARLTSGAKVQRFDEVATARVNVIAALGREPGFADAWRAARADIDKLGADLRVTAMKVQVDTLAMQLYSDAAAIGLARLDSAMAVEATTTAQAATVAVQRVRAAHAVVSGRVAEVADAQLEMYGAVYDLYDAALRELPASDTLAARVRVRRDALRGLLAAPQVGTAQVAVDEMGFMNRARFTWSASHPMGVPEYTVAEGSDSRRSLGSAGTYTTWKWTTDLTGGGLQPLQATLGARAAGGTRTERAAPPLTLTFARGSAAQPVSVTASALQPDVTAPSVPLVTASERPMTPNLEGGTTVWVTRGTPVALAWSASDAESGIVEYRYRVVERDPPTATPVLRLASLGTAGMSAAPGPVELLPWTSLGGRTTMLLTLPQVATGRVAQVELVAVNGAGITGSAGSLVLREDPTPPAATPVTAVLGVGGTFTVARPSLAASVVAPACPATEPIRLVNTVAPPALPPVTGTMLVTRPPIADPESGIAEWWVKVSDVRPTAVDGSGWVRLTDTSGTLLSVPGMPFEQARWIAVAARNGAGGFGAPVTTSAPVRLADPTAPGMPSFCLTGNGSSVSVRVQQKPIDPESGIRGYQVRLRTTSGAVVRDWPAAGAVDLPASVALDRTTSLPGVVPSAGGQLLMDMRSVNEGGLLGDQVASGPVLVDLTPPPAPTLTSVGVPSFNLATRTVQLKIAVSVAADPESGFGGLEVMVENDREEVVVPWIAIRGATVGSAGYTITLPGEVNGVRVSVRARNGLGMTSVVPKPLLRTY